MPDALDRLLTSLGACAPPGTDARTLADAVLLAVARTAARPAAQVEDDSAASAPPTDEPAPPGEPAPTMPPAATGQDPGVSAHVPGSTTRVRGTPLSLGRADPLPEILAVGRALQPFRRTWRRGSRTRLDIDATVDHYARGGPLIPLFSPRPERWFEVVVLVDRSLSMSVWQETAQALTRLLRGLGAFRAVHSWTWEWDEEARPRLRDQTRTRVSPDRVPHHGSGAQGRRLVLVVSDCTARGWHDPAPWKMLASWGRHVPVTLVDPLPQRLWRRSALDLPAVRATARHAGSHNAALRYRLPLRFQPHSGLAAELSPWQALPVAACTPHSLGSWARALMGTDPQGCDAVLVPATGRVTRLGPVGGDGATDPETLADAFLRTASAPAVRLAVLSSHVPELTLPLLHALREQAVPEARLADVAEVLTSGLLAVTRVPDHDPVLTFRGPARARLREHLTSHDAWRTLAALSRHLHAHPHTPHGIAAVLHSPNAVAELPAHLQPFAHAALATQRLLGIPAALSAGPEEAPSQDPAHVTQDAGTTDQFPWPWRGRLFAVVRTSGHPGAGSRFRRVGTGFLLGPRLVLAAGDLAQGAADDTLGAVQLRPSGVRVTASDWLDCRVMWRGERHYQGLTLLLVATGAAGPELLRGSAEQNWGALPGTGSLASCRVLVAEEGQLRTPTGVLHATEPPGAPHILALDHPLPPDVTVRPGTPVFHGDTFLGVVVAAAKEPSGSRAFAFTMAGIATLSRDPQFQDVVRRYMPGRSALTTVTPARRPARFLIGSLPPPWDGAPDRGSALAEDWAAADRGVPLVLGGDSAAEKRSYASARVRGEWQERRADVVIWASGSSTSEIRTRYAEAEAVIAGTGTARAEDGVDALFQRLRSMTRPWIVVIDGLDELPLPEEVLPPLTRYGRVVVTGEGPVLSSWSGAPATPRDSPVKAAGPRRRPMPGERVNFFLSRAPTEALDVYVRRFYDDLLNELRSLGADVNRQLPYRDFTQAAMAPERDRLVGREVGACQAFVALYSPSYFRSRHCGREFAAFSERLRRYREDIGIDVPSLIPVLWSPLDEPLPRTADRYRTTVSGLSDEYPRRGLRELLRSDPTGAAYREVVEAVADAVIHAHRFPVPFVSDLDLAHVQEAFPLGTTPERLGPSHVRMFIAGRTALDPSSYPPRYPALAHRAQRVVVDEGFTASLELVDETLEEHLDHAVREGQITILIVDPRVVRDPLYGDILTAFDRAHHPITGVIVTEVDTDGHAEADEEELWTAVASVFQRNWLRRNDRYDALFRARVDSEQFDSVLAVMVAVAVNRLMESSTPRRLPSGPPAPPLPGLSLPGPPYPGGEGTHDE
ncbi:FxsC protein [Streptomyces sp. NPDC049627]|uniref:FxsC protein n=1 Tax=Streptomyces sp. NPDC049627 TaxID=3365595 RepID=UPI003799730A